MLSQDHWARILPALAFVFFFSFSYSQDSIPRISTYHSAQYRAGASNYAVVKDHRDILYFANEQGVLEFDGAFWKLIELPNFAGARSVAINSDGLLLVGGVQDFGYLEPDSIGSLKFISLVPPLNSQVEFSDIWQISVHKGTTYFVAYEGIFAWDGSTVRFVDIDNTYLYPVGDTVYTTTYDGSFGYFKNDKIVPIFDQKLIDEDVVFQVYPWKNNDLLLLTTSTGLFTLGPSRQQPVVVDNSLSSAIKDAGFYESSYLGRGMFALGTWEGGVVISDSLGSELQVFDKMAGLSDNKINSLLRKGNDLWLATETGITAIDIESLAIQSSAPPTASIRRIICNDRKIIFDGAFYEYSNDVKSVLANQSANFTNTVSHLENSLTFYFSAPNVDMTDKVTFSYFLEGYDEEWSSWKTDTKKEFTDLRGGDYTFRVKARNSAGVESAATQFQFKVITPWYLTLTAVIAYAGIVAILIWLGYWYWSRTLRTMNTKLEAVIGQRTSELTRQKEELKKTNEELLLANSELDNFVYRSSHDFVAPLKSIKGLADVAKMETKDEEQVKYLNMIDDQVTKLEEFIGNIIDYSANSYAGLKHEVIDFNRMINDVIEDLQYYNNANKVEFKKRLIDINGAFESDPQRLRIILNNLVTNSIKYHDNAKQDPYVAVEVKGNGEAVIIAVEDNGIGISKDYQNKIYDMFFRASEDSEGSGLGLYIVKETVSKMDGNISVKSTEGFGTRFEIELKYNGNGSGNGQSNVSP